ncbi:NAD(P)(+) transhydrogenase (Re/Si-specific) subunit alpha [bacterium]|nr:NAD(P)(+) transhydrogenase (Re/Si-specific) subunit alpha [bacterium]|tara:strand:+ start:889 stop:2028 length:1140 start_codon:yes stop_codon:yes gene_type:complete
MVTIGIVKESKKGETRVSATPDTVKKLIAMGFDVLVESNAGSLSLIDDAAFKNVGAKIVDRKKAFGANCVCKVACPDESEIKLLKESAILIGSIDPFLNLKSMQSLTDKKITALAMEFLPRISRAQSMDSLSSQSNIAGYKAVLLGADHLGQIFPMMTTAAGTLSPARVVILGAGVAGLQAIATARRLGARVEVSDIRPETKEEVESLGGKFIEVESEEDNSAEGGYAKQVSKEFLAKQREVLTERISVSNCVISTALVPGKKAPVLITKGMVEKMKPGSVIVDMAAANGGNCELTKPGSTIDHKGVSILGPENIPALVPLHSSTVYAKNILNLITHMTDKDEKSIKVDSEDEIVGPMMVSMNGNIVEKRVKNAMEESK